VCSKDDLIKITWYLKNKYSKPLAFTLRVRKI